MTSIEWLIDRIAEKSVMEKDRYYIPYNSGTIDITHIIEQAKEMHKQEIIDAIGVGSQFDRGYLYGYHDKAEQYYQETFGQGITLQNNSESKGITELSNDSWEGCDGCTEQDEVMYKNGYVKGYNSAISELPKEISDEEIEKAARDYDNGDIYGPPLVNFEQGAFWYREQLKQRQ